MGRCTLLFAAQARVVSAQCQPLLPHTQASAGILFFLPHTQARGGTRLLLLLLHSQHTPMLVIYTCCKLQAPATGSRVCVCMYILYTYQYIIWYFFFDIFYFDIFCYLVIFSCMLQLLVLVYAKGVSEQHFSNIE